MEMLDPHNGQRTWRGASYAMSGRAEPSPRIEGDAVLPARPAQQKKRPLCAGHPREAWPNASTKWKNSLQGTDPLKGLNFSVNWLGHSRTQALIGCKQERMALRQRWTHLALHGCVRQNRRVKIGRPGRRLCRSP